MQSGIYKIVNIVNSKCYVGSTKDFNRREKEHFDDLIKQKHSSIKLQRSYNKHGKDKFQFLIIEIIPYEKEIIIERENYWIKELNSKSNGYNIADASFGDMLTHHPLKEEIIIKRSKTTKENNSKLSKEEFNLRFIESRKGDKNGMYGKKHSEESKHKMRIANIGTFEERYGKEKSDLVKNKMRIAFTEERRQSLSDKQKIDMKGNKNNFYGKTHTEDNRKIISEKVKNAFLTGEPQRKAEETRIKNGTTKKGILPSQLYNISKCNYCCLEATSSNITKWHNENCKLNPTNLNNIVGSFTILPICDKCGFIPDLKSSKSRGNFKKHKCKKET